MPMPSSVYTVYWIVVLVYPYTDEISSTVTHTRIHRIAHAYGGFIKGILRGVRCSKSLRVLFLHRRPPSWTTLVLYSRAVFIFNEPAFSIIPISHPNFSQTFLAEPVFVKVLGDQKSIPRIRFRQPMQHGEPIHKEGCRTGPPCWESISWLLKRFTNTGSGSTHRPVAGVLDEPFSQLTLLTGVAVQAGQSTWAVTVSILCSLTGRYGYSAKLAQLSKVRLKLTLQIFVFLTSL